MHIGIKRILIAVLSLMLITVLFGCDRIATREVTSDFFGPEDDDFWVDSDGGDDDKGGSDMPGQTQVPQATVDPSLPSWTVMLYLNGTNLESEGGEATSNLISLLSVDFPDSVNVVIYTGGTSAWQNDTISAEHNQIWHVEDGGIVLDESMDTKNIGESSTLTAFIDYTQTHYPSQKKALFFWDHGGGSILGFGQDDLYWGDSLTLDELGQAFADSGLDRKFDLVGFDACLMATVETASALAPYANYLVASEEVEPGGGWNYEYTYGQLAQNPDMTGEQLGIAVTDGYYNKYAGTGEEPLITCSLIDLGLIPALEETMGTFFASLNDSIIVPETMMAVSLARRQSESYGEDPTCVPLDIVDLYDFVDLQEDVDYTLTQALLGQIEDAVVYEVRGSQRLYSYGLSVYFPYDAPDYFADNLGVYNQFDFCPAYTTFINSFAEHLTDREYLDDVPDFDIDDIVSVPVDDYSEVGSFYVELTEEQIEYLSDVYCVLGWYLDEDTMVDLGYDSDLALEWGEDSVQVHDDFDYSWTLLNGQPVAVFIMDEVVNKYIIYNIPVLYNGDLAVVKGAWIWENEEYLYNGIYYTSNEYEPPNSKMMIELKQGDEITPVYPLLSAGDGDDGYRYGEPFYVDENGLYLEWGELPDDGVYEYGFMFIDVYGGVHYSDFILF